MPDDNASPADSPNNISRKIRPSAVHPPSSSSPSSSPTTTTSTAKHVSPSTNGNAQPPPRPPLRNNFDLEPNPFEQSFSVSSRTSLSSSSLSSLKAAATGMNVPDSSDGSTAKPGSPQAERKSPTQGSNGSAHSRKSSLGDGETPKPILPPLASITSPSDPSYAWSFSSAGISNSLRSGPLSPAMLAGPQTQPPVSSASQPASSVAALAASAASVHPPLFGFDPSGTFRTGLTPSTGLTPLVGGPVAFPPPSPNTAAFLAMMNSTGAGGAGATITPNTLSALTGVLQQSSGAQNGSTASSVVSSGAPPASVAPAQVSATAYSTGVSSMPRYSSAAYSLAQSQNDNYGNASSAATTAAANGLFLLSQAHQELTKREEAQKQSQAQVNGGGQNQNNPNMNGHSASAKRGSKRKSDAPSVTSQSSTTQSNKTTSAAPKRSRTTSTVNTGANTRSSARRGSTTASSNQDIDEEMDEDGDESDEDSLALQMGANTKSNQQKKPETEEEKRRNFLERNRQAALKCRQRKKAWLAQLQAKVEYLQNENERLTAALVSSREEISRLSTLVGGAGVGLPIAGVPVGGVGAIGVGAGHPHAVGQPLAHHLQHPHTMQVPHHLGPHHLSSQHPVAVSVSLPPGTTVATAHVQASPPMVSKGAPQGSVPQPHSPHSAASEGRSSRSSFRDYREGRDPRDRELNGHAPQAVAVNGRGYGY